MRVRIQTSSSNSFCWTVQALSTHGKGKPEYCLVTALQRNTLSNQIMGHPVTLGDWKHSGSKGKKDIRQIRLTIFTNWRQTRANWSGFPVIKGSSTSFIILRELNNQPNKTQQFNIILSGKKNHHILISQKNKVFKILPKHFLDILHRTYGTTLNRLEKKKNTQV